MNTQICANQHKHFLHLCISMIVCFCRVILLRGCVNLLEIATNNSAQIIFIFDRVVASVYVCVCVFKSRFRERRQRHSMLKVCSCRCHHHHLTERMLIIALTLTHTSYRTESEKPVEEIRLLFLSPILSSKFNEPCQISVSKTRAIA